VNLCKIGNKRDYMNSKLLWKSNWKLEMADDKIERDTADIEDVNNLLGVLLPDGQIPQDCSQFGFAFNKKLFDGWVKQPSPCCAAASLAGAWNCLSDTPRTHPNAINHLDILIIYNQILTDQMRKKIVSFERCLGAPINDLLSYFEEILFHKDAPKPKKGYAPTKSFVLSSIRNFIALFENDNRNNSTELGDSNNISEEKIDSKQRVAVLLKELLADENTNLVDNNDDAIEKVQYSPIT
jgi:hypothetical protein